jgi:hypothetical protein
MIRWLIPFLLMVGAASAQTAVPDPTLTPGAVRTADAADVCSHETNQLRHMSRNQPRPSCGLSEARSEFVNRPLRQNRRLSAVSALGTV